MSTKIETKAIALIQAVMGGVFVTPSVTTNGCIKDVSWWIDLNPYIPNSYPPKMVTLELLRDIDLEETVELDLFEGKIFRGKDTVYVSIVLADESSIECSFSERAVSISHLSVIEE